MLEETGVAVTNLRLIDVVDSIAAETDQAPARHLTLVDFRGDWAGGEPMAGDDAVEATWCPVKNLASYGLWSETVRIIESAVAMVDCARE